MLLREVSIARIKFSRSSQPKRHTRTMCGVDTTAMVVQQNMGGCVGITVENMKTQQCTQSLRLLLNV